MSNSIDRRHFLRAGAVAGLATGVACQEVICAADKTRLRLAVIGVGSRGTHLMRLLLVRKATSWSSTPCAGNRGSRWSPLRHYLPDSQ